MVKALIAVKSNSKRVPHKNSRPFAGSSLLKIKIEQLQRPGIDVVVNSDCESMLWTAKAMGCETVKRDPKYVRDDVSMSEVYRHMAENFPADIVMYANVTNPLIKDSTIRKLKTMYDGTSVNTCHHIREFLWRDGKPLNYDPQKQPRSQDLPDIYALNFAVSIISRADMIKYGNVVHPKPKLVPISEVEAVDIDTMNEFKFAEWLYLRERQ